MQKNGLLVRIVNWLNNIATQKVKKYGAQYTTFGIFGLINYPVAIIYEVFFTHIYETIAIRVLASILNLGLVLQKYWPKDLIKFLPLYWFVTILISLSTMATYLLLCNNFSPEYLTNYNVGVILAILLLDFTSFAVVTFLGACIGCILFFLASEVHLTMPPKDQLYLFSYLFFCITIFGAIFSRNKEVFVYYNQRAKDEINAQLESIIEERTLELRKALAAKTEFLNNMSHEVRTPIQGFVNVSEGLVSHWKDFDEKRRYDLAKNININAKRLSNLVGSLLDLSKFSNEKMILDVKKFNIDTIIKEVIDECNSFYINEKKIKIKFSPSEVLELYADKERVGQVLRNLLTNAIKFSSNKDESTILVETSKISHKNSSGDFVSAIKISIQDEGLGIPETELETIFSPFNQSSRTKTKAGGTGLGLTICREIINSHGGTITASNNKGGGATFEVIIPVADCEDKSNESIRKPSKIQIQKKDNIKVLVIDDEETCLISIELLLTNTPYKLIKAQSGKEGLKILEEQEIDIVLLDLMMPDLYGIKVLESIRENEKTKHIPVILQSGATDMDEIERAQSIGISSYIRKPYRREELLSEIKEIIKD